MNPLHGSTDAAFVAYVLAGDCGGPELECVAATDQGGTFVAEIERAMEATARSYVLVVAAAGWGGPSAFRVLVDWWAVI